MLNNFIYAQTKYLFLEQLNAGNILDEAIVFIEDTKEIWNHGHYFGGISGSGIDPEILSGIETAIATLQSDKADKSELSDYAKKNELPSLDGYLTKTVADGLYATIAQYNALNQTVGNIQTELSNKLTSADLADYAKTSDVPTKISDLEDDSDFITNAEATAAYAPKSLVEIVSNQATTISTLATKDALSTGLAGKLDNSAASGFVPTTRKVNGVALDQDITITATDLNAATKTELNDLSTNLTSEINKKATSATTLAGYGITDGVNIVDDVQTGTYITDITIEGHTLKTTRGSHTVTGKEVTDALGYTPLQGADITDLASKTDVSNAVTPVSNRVTAIEDLIAADSDAVIDKWDEVVTFLDGIGADNDLEALLAAKANSSTVSALETRVTNLTTNNIAEGDNLYFTNARAVSALSNTLASYVPTSRTINGKKLTGDITLSASDVGAASTGELNTINTNLANLTSTVDDKVNKVSGKGLSTNDFTTALKDKLDALPTTFAPTNAEANVQTDWNVTDSTSDAFIKNKPTIPSKFTGSSATTSGNSGTAFSAAPAKHTHSVTAKGSVSSSFTGSASCGENNGTNFSAAPGGHTHNVTASGSVSSSFTGSAVTSGGPSSNTTSVATAAHTHSVTGTVANGGASHNHSFTPAGSVSSSFTGSAVTSGTPNSTNGTTSVATAAHTHSVTGTVANGGASHSHGVSGNTGGASAYSHTHKYVDTQYDLHARTEGDGVLIISLFALTPATESNKPSTSSGGVDHTHGVNITSAATTATHSHTFSSGSASATADNTTNRVSVAGSAHTHNVTASGSVSSSFTGTASNTGSTTATHSHTFSSGSASATADNTTNRVSVPNTSHTHSVTAAGSVSSSFTGSAATSTANSGTNTSVAPAKHTHSVTVTGSVSSSFTGSAATSGENSGTNGSVAPSGHTHTVTATGSIA